MFRHFAILCRDRIILPCGRETMRTSRWLAGLVFGLGLAGTAHAQAVTWGASTSGPIRNKQIDLRNVAAPYAQQASGSSGFLDKLFAPFRKNKANTPPAPPRRQIQRRSAGEAPAAQQLLPQGL
jgi:hypothetical protein